MFKSIQSLQLSNDCKLTVPEENCSIINVKYSMLAHTTLLLLVLNMQEQQENSKIAAFSIPS